MSSSGECFLGPWGRPPVVTILALSRRREFARFIKLTIGATASMKTELKEIITDLPLARRIETAEAWNTVRFVEARQRLFHEYGAEWTIVDGVYVAFDGVKSPLTRSFGLGLCGDVSSDTLSNIEDFFHVRGANSTHRVSPLCGESALQLLNGRGYRPVQLVNVLYRPLDQIVDFPVANSANIDVRIVGQSESELWAQTSATGWSETHPDTLEFARLNAAATDSFLRIAELFGKPVATGRPFLHDGVALMVGACTINAARNQGAQTALLVHRLRYAAEQGCDLAAVAALPGGTSHRNAERLGFRVAYTRIKWQLQ